MYAEAEITKLDTPMVLLGVSDAEPISVLTEHNKKTIRIDYWNEYGIHKISFAESWYHYLNETSLKKLVDSGTTKLVVTDTEHPATLLTITMLTGHY
jgi:hypothetical protein